MSEASPQALARATEVRRRALPATAAFVILTGGLAAAIMGQAGAIGWAVAVTVLLVGETELYRRLEMRSRAPGVAAQRWTAAAAFLGSCVYAALPTALWWDGTAAGCAAALGLWVAGGVRHVGGGWTAGIAAAGAAPPIVSLALTPVLKAASTAQPDWDAAVIAVLSGVALILFVARARLAARDERLGVAPGSKHADARAALAQILFDADAFSAFLLDRDLRVVAMSNRVRERWSMDEAEGRPFDEVCPWRPEDWAEQFAVALQGAHVSRVEDEIQTPLGRRWVSWDAMPWRDEAGEIKGLVVHSRDRTDEVQARRTAEANEQRLRMALGASRGVVWEIDLKYETLHWYGDAAPIYGREMTLNQFMAANNPLLADEDRAFVQASFDACVAGEIESFEHRIKRADGSWGWAAVWVRGVRGRSGEVRRVIGQTKDISARKQDEESFLAAMARAEGAIRAKRVMLMDAEASSPPAAIAQAIGSGGETLQRVNVQQMFERLDSLLDEMDARDALLAETLESLRSARELAEHASVSKSRFLAGMSHELRTPLNAIIGYSEILLEEAEDDGRESDQKDIGRVLVAAHQLLGLINEILDLSKIEAGRMDVSVGDFDIADLVAEAVDTVRPMADKNGNVIEVDIEEGIGAARSDALKITQCLLNLLSNASKFTSEGQIVVKARRDATGEWVEMSVADTGIGINEAQVKRLFQPYVQAEASTAQKFGGTGLGLVITRRMMQLLGGDVSVQSTHGKGSTFTLRWPAQIEPVAAEDGDEQALAGAGGEHVVLIIDDEESARDLVARALGRIGVQVRCAETAASGMALARSVKPSLIILDINLPDLTGWELMQTMRADPVCAEIPIIVHSVDDDRKRAMALGACEHLVKPADRDVLAAVVARIVRPAQASVISAAQSPAPPSAKSA
jgi:PAS domain S-box-containing protein